MIHKENSPFTPGSPVPVELFVGRSEQIEELTHYITQSLSGRQQNVFLLGDRGIGKSSIAAFLHFWAEKYKNMLGVHIFLGGVTDLNDVVRHIFEEILKESKGENWFDNIKGFFGKYVKEVGLLGISLSFSPPEDKIKEIKKNFPEALFNLMQKLEEQKEGLLIVLDDINGVAKSEEFANWYKSFVDKVATHYPDFKVLVMLIGLPEVWDNFLSKQSSLTRVFRVTEIERLSEKDVKKFFKKAFNKGGMEVRDDALNFMTKYSGGLPILMQEIGDAVFWHDEDGIINFEDATIGVYIAAERIGRKYLDPKIYRAIRSTKYLSILKKFNSYSRSFTRKELMEKLNRSEKKVLDNFLQKMKELDIIEQDMERGRGAYRFVNLIYPLYIWIESERDKKE